MDDPLVPEIAQTYLKDHEAYWQAAKLYTERYALQERPEKSTLVFLEELEETGTYNSPPPKPKRSDTLNMQSSFLNFTNNELWGSPPLSDEDSFSDDDSIWSPRFDEEVDAGFEISERGLMMARLIKFVHDARAI